MHCIYMWVRCVGLPLAKEPAVIQHKQVWIGRQTCIVAEQRKRVEGGTFEQAGKEWEGR